MKNYQEALDEIFMQVNKAYIDACYAKATKQSMRKVEDIVGINIKILQELVNEKVEQESRKDKLIVGSKWECVANCYCEFWGDCLKIEKGTVVQLQSNHGHTLAISRGIMPTQQFLLCFKPLKEGE